MKGSQKQIEWAERIRESIRADVSRWTTEEPTSKRARMAKDVVLPLVERVDDAVWFIENRNFDVSRYAKLRDGQPDTDNRLLVELRSKVSNQNDTRPPPILLPPHDPRNPHAEAVDKGVTAKTVTTNAAEWAKRRERIDLAGVDTKRPKATVRVVPFKEPKVPGLSTRMPRISRKTPRISDRVTDLGGGIVRDRRGRHLRLY